ncbi:hypothetical protein MasN3_27410 [Massilia varians]|uniref:Uncharacterized protein n=1 Tax=Massilia varians TaxID=457921 RepID=A0ABM8C7K0_9BURK|nr:hypothetical protein [Massilia varians]BDT59247.1 hypothetical protein MasN3_27410 [Massilia varians]
MVALPASNVTAYAKVSLGGARLSEPGANVGVAVIQVKTLFRPYDA